ncbi:MAG: methyl-accepting chemotaxis protein [Prochloraceae cyanobacterium]
MTQSPAKPDSHDDSINNSILTSEMAANEQATSSDQFYQNPSSSQEQAKVFITLETEDESQTVFRQKQQKSFWQSMRFRAIFIAVAIGTIPVLAIGGISYYFTYRTQSALKAEIINHQEDMAANLANKVSTFVSNRISELELIASSPILTDSKLSQTASLEQQQRWLNSLLATQPDFYQSIAVFDLQGNLKLQAISSNTNPRNYQGRNLIKQALQNQDQVLVLFTAETNNQPVVIIAKLIKELTTGEPLGAIGAQIPAQKLQKLLDISVQEKRNYLILDGDKNVILTSETAREVGKLMGEMEQEFALLKQQSIQNTVEKDNAIYTYLPIQAPKDFESLNWSMLLSTQVEGTFAHQKPLQLTLFVGTMLVTLLVAIFAAILAERATRPILAAAGAVAKIGQGQLDTRLPVQGQDEVATLSRNINQMATKLESLVYEQAFLAKQSRLLAEISSSPTINKQDGETVLTQSLEGAREILEVERMVIYRLQLNGSGYIAHESVVDGWPIALNYQIQDPCIPASLLQEYLQGRVAATDNVFEANLQSEHLQLMEQLQVKANLVVPILNQGQLYGLLIAHHCTSTHEWREREINFMKQLAAQLGLILDRVAFIDERQEEAKRSESLKEITLKIASSFNPEVIFETTVTDIRQTLQTDRVVVYTFDENWSGTIIAESVGDNWPRALGVEISDPCFAQEYADKYKEGRVHSVADIYQADLTNCHLQQLEPFAVKANIVAPVLVDGELLGLLIAHQCSGPRNWEQAEIDFFSQIATQIGLALERVNLLEQQKNAKEQIEKRALELLMEVDPVSKGDLTISARVTEDEIGTVADFYNATIENLRKIVTQVQVASTQVAATTNKNQTSVQALSAGAMQQRRDIEAALAQIQLMTSSIRAVADNAKQAELSVQEASETVEEGEKAMNRTVQGIMAIRETVAETAKKVKRLGESSQKISRVVSLISSFAEQTNLLALNASIEAAHAGEEGRGFAVVADEVRSLAAQSAEATAEIEKLIAAIQAETNEVVAAMEAGTSQVVSGTRLVDETRSSLDKIASASSQINQLVKDIAQAAEEQAQTSETVNQRIAEVAAVSNQTSAEAEQVSECFRELLSVAEALQESVGQFKVN